MPDRDYTRSPLVAVIVLLTAVALWALRDVLLLVGFAALLAFALDPLVSGLEHASRGRVSRGFAAGAVMLALVGLGVWALVAVVPRVVRELGEFVDGAPASLDRLLAAVRAWAETRGLGTWLGPLAQDRGLDAADLLAQAGRLVLSEAGKLLDNLGALVGLALVPMLAFYLLAEREAVESSTLRFVPEDVRPRVQALLGAVDRALRSYVRGQSVVCLVMGITVGTVLAVVGMPASALLGVIVAVAEVVPILGFWTATLAIVLAGFSVSPLLALGGWLAYVIANQLVGLLVTPRVMGRHMKLHPFVVTVSILAGAALMGAPGAVLALPLAAALQSLVAELASGRARRGAQAERAEAARTEDA
jgi:predicted PurR-regulated permease PerM